MKTATLHDLPAPPWRRRPAGLRRRCRSPPARCSTACNTSGALRVCIWPDYYGITFRSPRTQQLAGIDIDLSAEFARDLGAKLEYVDSSFPTLIDDLKADRCDVAMFAIGMLPQRMEHLKFTRPTCSSDIYGVTTKGNRVVTQWADIDKPGVQVAVQAGTFMEPVMAAA
jgi:cyclohexadienyl dehydratase